MTAPSRPSQVIPDPTHPVTTVDLPCGAGPFTDIRPHARGGLGEVFRATDPELHRTVAVKRLHARHAGNADVNWRFLQEAELTARLEHPGVVPVYRLFRDADGQAAYAMRFVEGQTLAEAIAAYHAGPPDPVAFRRLLQAFFQVCQTVAYAHSRGIIHRDLKPANVLLGKFGETLVIDWGLAKVVGRPEEARDAGAAETLVPSGPDSGSGETAMGSAVGTPAYMSPEQAAGRWDVADHRSDVYGLGAVLYTVLTGRPPLEKGNWPEMQQRIQRGDFPRPRQLKSAVPRPLEAVCLKAMALEPPARYSSAGTLAADVERWLADEPVQAWPEPWSQRLARWARRHKPVVVGMVVLLLTAVVALAISSVVVRRQAEQTEVASAQHLRTASEYFKAASAHEKLTLEISRLKREISRLKAESPLEVWDQAIGDSGAYTSYPRVQRAVCLARAGRHVEAIAEAEVLTEEKDLPGHLLYGLARVYSLAAAGKSDSILTKQYAERALDLLSRAKAAGFFATPAVSQRLLGDPDFDALRKHEDFKKLRQQLP